MANSETVYYCILMTCRDRAYIIEVKSSSTDDRPSNLAPITTSYGGPTHPFALTAPRQETGEGKGISHVLANEKDIYRTQVELVEERKRREAFFGRMHSRVELYQLYVSYVPTY